MARFGPCDPEWVNCGELAAICPCEAAVGEEESAVQEASEILWWLSGKAINGVCESTVRPCGTSYCAEEIELEAPVLDIISVHVDGVLIDPDTYAVRNGRYLRRLATIMSVGPPAAKLISTVSRLPL